MRTKRINALTALMVLLFLNACVLGSLEKDENVVLQNDAIDDFIVVAELEEIDEIRALRHLRHKELTENYVILRDQRRAFLLEFTRRCHELRDTQVTPDYRTDLRTLRARFDTFRGCRIDRLFEISEGQAKELEVLGESSRQQEN